MTKIIKPTDEQTAIINRARSGESFMVIAGAGCAKTTSTRMAAEAVGDATYFAYNTSAKDSARGTFPKSCRVMTGHGLAFEAGGRDYGNRLTQSVWALKRAWVEQQPNLRNIADEMLATFNTFLNSADRKVLPDHTPYRCGDVERVVHETQRMFDAARGADGVGLVTHDYYMKCWELDGAVIDSPTIFIDEAQDLSPVMLSIVAQNAAVGKQTIYVGDPYQQIYAFRGAVNALQSLDLPTLTLTQTWRFGQDVAEVANSVLEARKAPFEMSGLGSSSVHVGLDTDATGVIARTNGGIVAGAWQAASSQRAIHILGGVEQLTDTLEAAYAVSLGKRTMHPGLRYFGSWHELKAAVETQKAAAEFKPFVKMVEEYGGQIPEVCETLKAANVRRSEADVTFGTTHKFKGQEATRLQVHGDFGPFCTYDSKKKQYSLDEEGANIAYVAVTRAEERLTLSPEFAATLATSLKNIEGYWDRKHAPLETVPRERLALVLARSEAQSIKVAQPPSEPTKANDQKAAPSPAASAAPSDHAKANGKASSMTTVALLNADKERTIVGEFVGMRSVKIGDVPTDVAVVKAPDHVYLVKEVDAFKGLDAGSGIAVVTADARVNVFVQYGSAEAMQQVAAPTVEADAAL